MKVISASLACLIIAAVVPAHAAAPKEPVLKRYESLWTDSPFTSKPPEVAPPSPPSLLEDYTLASLCRIEHGWHVVLLHKKDRSKRIRLNTHGFTESGFRIVSVESPSTREARVEIDANGQTGWVRFESEFLVVRKKTTARRTQPGAGQGQANRLRKVPPSPPVPGYKTPNVRRKPIGARK